MPAPPGHVVQIDILKDVPEDATPRSPWPFADRRKQVGVEDKFFEDGATIHFDRLAPLQSWAPLTGMDMQARTNFVATQVVRLAAEANTRLSQAEIDGIAETSAKNFKRGAWAVPTALLFAGATVYHGRAEFKFPFFKPVGRSWFHPEAFPSTRFAVLKGKMATYAWHAARGMVYYPAWKLATTFFYVSVSRMSISADVMRDPRLSRLRDRVLQHIQQDNPRLQKARQQHQQQQHDQGHVTSQSSDQAESDQRDETYRRVGLTPPSPEELRKFSRQRQTPATRSSEQEDSQTPVEWTSTERQQQAPTPPQAPQAPSSSWGDSELFDDDASPVSPAARRAEQARSAPQQQSGASSWDQIRQQAKSDASPFQRGDRSRQDNSWGRIQQEAATPDRSRADRPSPSNGYGSSETGEAKSQAQKDFDAMLEAERKGESSGGGGRWR
ncbi:hypothetical protein BJ166DRAFT_163249 [Pestalotiopsis sp. NC0098]|nr:hypothetical protein BJ166DRAFT_163249 [Pestalotiopsis sp. NC0098]